MDAEPPHTPVGAAPAAGTTPEQVFGCLLGVVSPDASVRGAAEAALRSWEADAVPRFLSSLVDILNERGSVDEARARWPLTIGCFLSKTDGRTLGSCGIRAPLSLE